VAEDKASFEEVSNYPIDPEKMKELFALQTECAICWSTSDGWPIGVIHRFVWRDEKIWATCSGQRKRVPALRRNPKSCVIVSSEGTKLGSDQTVTMKTTCRVHEDRETKDWFYPALAKRLTRTPDQAEFMVKMFDTPRRVVLELTPVKFISYAGTTLAAAVARTLGRPFR